MCLPRMHLFKVLSVIFAVLGLSTSSPFCTEVTHTACEDLDHNIFLQATVQDKEVCQLMCTLTLERCKFSLFDKKSYTRENCRLYDINFSEFILHCNELSGPKQLPDGCNLEYPPDNTCQIYRSGTCDFGREEENYKLESWEHCHQTCKATSQCELWRFEQEEGNCKILYSRDHYHCYWEFSPREPSFDECENPTCDIPNPQEHGEWFCPPTRGPFISTCHLECDPGYVSDSVTVIKCVNGVWSSTPTCVEAIGLITGLNSVEIYGVGLHKKLPDLPDIRMEHSLDFVNSVVLLCGGPNIRDTETSCLTMTSSQEWIHHSNTMGRSWHSSVSMLGKLHLLGGEASSFTTEYLFPPSDQWHQSWNLLETTFFACATKIAPETLLISGGSDHSYSLISYNVINGAAIRLQNLITARFGHGCGYVKQKSTGFRGILVAGGSNGNNSLSSSEMYDISTGEWSLVGSLSNEKVELTIVVLGDNILAMGGGSLDNERLDREPFANVDRFNFTTMSWMATEPMLEARIGHAATGIPPNLVGIGTE